MYILVKIAAIIFFGLDLLGYGWWDRDYLSFIDKAFLLSPAIGLLLVGALPFSYLTNKKLQVILTIIISIGAMQTVHGIIKALGSPIEPDTPAAMLDGIVLAILIGGVYLVWKYKKKEPNQ